MQLVAGAGISIVAGAVGFLAAISAQSGAVPGQLVAAMTAPRAAAPVAGGNDEPAHTAGRQTRADARTSPAQPQWSGSRGEAKQKSKRRRTRIYRRAYRRDRQIWRDDYQPARRRYDWDRYAYEDWRRRAYGPSWRPYWSRWRYRRDWRAPNWQNYDEPPAWANRRFRRHGYGWRDRGYERYGRYGQYDRRGDWRGQRRRQWRTWQRREPPAPDDAAPGDGGNRDRERIVPRLTPV